MFLKHVSGFQGANKSTDYDPDSKMLILTENVKITKSAKMNLKVRQSRLSGFAQHQLKQPHSSRPNPIQSKPGILGSIFWNSTTFDKVSKPDNFRIFRAKDHLQSNAISIRTPISTFHHTGVGKRKQGWNRKRTQTESIPINGTNHKPGFGMDTRKCPDTLVEVQ